MEAALTGEKTNIGKLRSELHTTRQNLSRREIDISQHQENIQKLSQAYANSERHRTSLQVSVVNLAQFSIFNLRHFSF